MTAIGDFDIVTVQTISQRGATCVTSYNSEVFVSWGSSLPADIPKIGEMWSVQKIDFNTWQFRDRQRSGSYNVMRYAIELDARTCIGKERGIVDDIRSIGVNEVYLKVAGDGMVLWESDSAEDFGLMCYGDHVTQIVKRLHDYGIAITFVIDSQVWSNVVEDTAHRRYQQRYYTQDGKTLKYSSNMSFSAAAEPMRTLVDELYNKYSYYARGVCFSNFYIDGEHGDFSQASCAAYVSLYGSMPTFDLTEEQTDDDWWERHFQWTDFLADQQKRFLRIVKKNIGNWPISAITSSGLVSILTDEQKVGRLSTGIQDDFATYGWESVGFPLRYTMQTDHASELRSLEFIIACEQRFAKGSTPVYILDLEHLKQYDGVFSMLAKYEASTVLLSSYDAWRLMSDAQVIDLQNAMDKYRVSEKSTLDTVGIVVSSNSRDIGAYDIETNHSFTKSLEGLCSLVLDKLPHKLRIFFDADIEDATVVDDTAALIVYMMSNMSDNAINTVETMLEKEDRGVCIIGRCGYMADTSTEQRDYPFIETFGQSDFLIQEYVSEIQVGPSQLDVTVDSFVLNNTNVGINPVLDTGNTMSFIQVVQDGTMVNQKTLAPLLFKGRSSMLAIDVIRDDLLLNVSSELALYSVGRDG